MDNRKVKLPTFRTTEPNRIVKAWISHHAESKSYRLTVVPVEVKVYSDGVVVHTVVAYSGFTGHVADAPRYSRKRLEALAVEVEVLDRVCELAVSLGGIIEV